jgi:NAD(P)-dependent dehydrogenase (short-subunit alcohol dehydrogenase family)
MLRQANSYQGRTALITGAGGGIGSVTAQAFARRGYAVVASDIKMEAAEATASAIRAEGGEAIAVQADISEPDSVQALFGQIRERFGRLDAAFNNAGVSVPRVPLLECPDEMWHRCIDVNLTGTWYCLKAEIALMLEQGGGCIVNNGSIFSMNAGPSTPYTASKHGIAGLTRSAALAYAAKGVRVNAVCPGLIEAGMGMIVINRADAAQQKDQLYNALPVGHPGAPEEVAQAVLWLCSDEASYIHGHLLAVDGGIDSR